MYYIDICRWRHSMQFWNFGRISWTCSALLYGCISEHCCWLSKKGSTIIRYIFREKHVQLRMTHIAKIYIYIYIYAQINFSQWWYQIFVQYGQKSHTGYQSSSSPFVNSFRSFHSCVHTKRFGRSQQFPNISEYGSIKMCSFFPST